MNESTPIVVNANAGWHDLLFALGRYILIIIGFAPVILPLLRNLDILGLMTLLQSSEGAKLSAAVGGFIALVWGLVKSHKRGSQVADIAKNPDVPDRIATTK